MYRIHFSPQGGFWCVQFERWGLFWESVKETKVSPEGKSRMEVLQFETYAEAEIYVEKKGIDKIYLCRSGEPPALLPSHSHSQASHEGSFRVRSRPLRRVSFEKDEKEASAS